MRRADFAIITRRALCAGAVLGWALTAAPGACAQGAYPSRPIVMVVPQAAAMKPITGASPTASAALTTIDQTAKRKGVTVSSRAK